MPDFFVENFKFPLCKQSNSFSAFCADFFCVLNFPAKKKSLFTPDSVRIKIANQEKFHYQFLSDRMHVNHFDTLVFIRIILCEASYLQCQMTFYKKKNKIKCIKVFRQWKVYIKHTICSIDISTQLYKLYHKYY